MSLGCEIVLVAGVVAGIGWLFWWMIRYLRSARASTYGRCEKCGLRMKIEPYECPRCGHEIRERIKDSIDVAKARQFQEERRPRRKRGADENEVSVFSSTYGPEASVIRGMLQRHGIKCRLEMGKSIGLEGRSPAPSFVHVVAWSGDVDAAKELIEAVRVQ